MHMAYIQDMEAIHQGKKIKVQKGEIEIFFRAKIESDPEGKMENHWILRNFKEIYEHRIIHDEIEKREKELWRDVYKIQSKIKDYLNLRNYLPTAPGFFPRKYGWEE